MQQSVLELTQLGLLPSETTRDIELVNQCEQLLNRIETPISDAEAQSLIGLFGFDECFGLAWKLLHVVETAPNWPIMESLQDKDNEWVQLLRSRADLDT